MRNVRRYSWSNAIVLMAFVCLACTDGTGSISPPPDAIGETTPGGDALEDSQAPPPLDPPPGTTRFIHIADLHIPGEAEDEIPQNKAQAMEELNAITFDAEYVVCTGDIVHWILDGLAPEDPSPLNVAMDAFAMLRWPVLPVAGNHDYYAGPYAGITPEVEARRDYLEAVMGYPLDYSVISNGVRLTMLDSMGGDQAEPTRGMVGSFSDEQLDWLRAEVKDGRPTILFFHHPPANIETPTGDSLCAVIEENRDTIKGIFAGHIHTFLEGEYCGIPYYIVAHVVPGTLFHLEVEYDSESDSLRILNEDDVPFTTTPEFECDEDDTTLPDPGALVGTHQLIWMGNMNSNLPGLEGFDGAVVDETPFVLKFDNYDEVTDRLEARLTMALNEDDFVAVMPGAPCVPLTFDLAGPCLAAETNPFTIDLAPLLGAMFEVEVDPSWQLRVDVQSMSLAGHAVTPPDSSPHLDSGIVALRGNAAQGVADTRRALVIEYCAGNLENCQPGSADRFPECDDPPREEMFDEIPRSCDLFLGNFSLRFLLNFVSAYPVENLKVDADFHSDVWPTAATPTPFTIDQALFSTDPGANCAP